MKATTRAELEAFWRAHLDGWRLSDLNQREYCEAHGLPPRFSECLKIYDRLKENGAARRPRLVRANLIHSLLVFDRRADLSLVWDFGLTGDTKCMAADAEAYDALGL